VADSVVGSILSLKVRAAVMGGDRVTSWRDLVASFYDTEQSTAPSESVILSRAGNPVASTIGAAPDAEVDRTADIWPEGTGYQMVELTASVRMQSLQAGIPGNPQSVFGQVYLYATAPAVQSVPPEQQMFVVASSEPTASTSEPSVVTITNTDFNQLMSVEDASVLG
jgi:hypothetical protein